MYRSKGICGTWGNGSNCTVEKIKPIAICQQISHVLMSRDAQRTACGPAWFLWRVSILYMHGDRLSMFKVLIHLKKIYIPDSTNEQLVSIFSFSIKQLCIQIFQIDFSKDFDAKVRLRVAFQALRRESQKSITYKSQLDTVYCQVKLGAKQRHLINLSHPSFVICLLTVGNLMENILP